VRHRRRTAEVRHPRSRRATYGATDDELIGVLDRTTNALLDASRALWLAWIGSAVPAAGEYSIFSCAVGGLREQGPGTEGAVIG